MRSILALVAALIAAFLGFAADAGQQSCGPLARLTFDQLMSPRTEPITTWVFDHGDKTTNGCTIIQAIQSVCRKHRDWTVALAWDAMRQGTVQAEPQRHMCGA